jgi:iron complex transport system substrate-binding protein
MKSFDFKLLCVFILFSFIACKKNEKSDTLKPSDSNNQIAYSKNLAIYKHDGFSIVKVINPWPEANTNFTYILKEKNGTVPDSLKKYKIIPVPLQSIIVTSTTNIPFLEMIGVEKKLIGFPNTNYISSKKTRQLIKQGLVKDVGQNEKLNIEQVIDLSPNLVVAFGIDNYNPVLENLEKSGIPVLLQADWMEQSPLGKAEWIKLFGALFDKEKEAKMFFENIVKNYKETLKLVASKKASKTVLYGTMYEDQWYIAKGDSWVAQFLKDCKSNYLWQNESGSGSLPLPFEAVFEKANNADVWITGTFKDLQSMEKSNPHYNEFLAFKNKQVYSFENNFGETGGSIYYETASSRPDLVLKDYIKIFHPDLLPNYTFTYANQLK